MKKLKKSKIIETEEYPHFRWYKKANHPALIINERTNKEYNFKKVTHSKKEGRHLNEKIDPNPNKLDDKSMYISKRVRHDKKSTFSLKLPWKYPKK